MISTTEAAAYIGVHVNTLRKWVKDGKVRPAYVSPGGQMKWDKTRLRGPSGQPCCAQAKELRMAHGWWFHVVSIFCDHCLGATQTARQLIDGSHICPSCDLTWNPYDQTPVGIHE